MVLFIGKPLSCLGMVMIWDFAYCPAKSTNCAQDREGPSWSGQSSLPEFCGVATVHFYLLGAQYREET